MTAPLLHIQQLSERTSLAAGQPAAEQAAEQPTAASTHTAAVQPPIADSLLTLNSVQAFGAGSSVSNSNVQWSLSVLQQLL